MTGSPGRHGGFTDSSRAEEPLHLSLLPTVIMHPIGPGVAPHNEVMINTSLAGMVAGFFRDRLGGGQRGD